jgi:hypothetical protein
MTTTSKSIKRGPEMRSSPQSSLSSSETQSQQSMNNINRHKYTNLLDVGHLMSQLVRSFASFVEPQQTPAVTSPLLSSSNDNNNHDNHELLLSPRTQTFLKQASTNFQWLNDIMGVSYFVVTDALGLRTLNHKLKSSNSISQLQRQLQNFRQQYQQQQRQKRQKQPSLK